MHRERQRTEAHWNDAARSQEELEDARKRSPLELSEGARPCRPLDFRPPELWAIKFLMFEAIVFLVICYSSPCSDGSRPESYNTIIKHKLGVFKKSSFFFLVFGQSIQVNPRRSPFDSHQWYSKSYKSCPVSHRPCPVQGSLWDVGCRDAGCPSIRHLLCASCDIQSSQVSGWNLLWCVLTVSPCRASQCPPQIGQCSSLQMPFEKVILRRIKIPELGDLWSDKMKLKPLPPKTRIYF